MKKEISPVDQFKQYNLKIENLDEHESLIEIIKFYMNNSGKVSPTHYRNTTHFYYVVNS